MSLGSELVISSFNCQNYKTSTEYISSLFNETDIIALQETWLMPNELNLPSILNDDVDAFSVSAMNISEKLHVGRPFGGISFIWKKNISKFVSIRTYNDSRILGLSLSFQAKSILLLNVYFPTTGPDGDDEFSHYIGKITSIIAECDEENVCVIGDFNASPGSARFTELLSMCGDHQLKVGDVETLPLSSYSHVNHGSLSRTWLDHCLVSEGLFSSMLNCRLLDDFSVSDHCPLVIQFNIQCLPQTSPVINRRPSINWDFDNSDKLDRFYNCLDASLQSFPTNSENLQCARYQCTEPGHATCIERSYGELNAKIIECGRKVFGTITHKGKNIPGWNLYVRTLYDEYRRIFLLWRSNGSPRQGEIAVSMRKSRASFKLALRWCRQNELKIKSQALATKLANRDTKGFWKEIRSTKATKSKLPHAVDEIEGECEIAEMWQDQFRHRFNCIENSKSNLHVNVGSVEFEPLSAEEICLLSEKLGRNKSVGADDIPAEVYKYGSPTIFRVLACLFNKMLSNTFLPSELMKVLIVPLIKNQAVRKRTKFLLIIRSQTNLRTICSVDYSVGEERDTCLCPITSAFVLFQIFKRIHPI